LTRVNDVGSQKGFSLIILLLFLTVTIGSVALADGLRNSTVGSSTSGGGYGGGSGNSTDFRVEYPPSSNGSEDPDSKLPERYVNTSDDPNAPVMFDMRVLDELTKNGWVSVLIKVKDTSNIIVTREDDPNVFVQKNNVRMQQFQMKTDRLLSILAPYIRENKIIIQSILAGGRGFSANITASQIINVIRNDTDVKAIYLNEIVSIASSKIIIVNDTEQPASDITKQNSRYLNNKSVSKAEGNDYNNTIAETVVAETNSTSQILPKESLLFSIWRWVVSWFS
jgi:hypothetical protein